MSTKIFLYIFILFLLVPTGILNAQEIAAMFIHYSEDSSEDLKKAYPLPFSAQPRPIPPQKYEKLVSKNVADIEEEKVRLAQNEHQQKTESKKRGNNDSANGNTANGIEGNARKKSARIEPPI